MAIYVFVEVARRELEGRLLLALAAAERGHDVLLGKIPRRALHEGRLGAWRLPPGVLHLKSIVGSPRFYEQLDRFRASGSAISVQDEEHGLAGPLEYDEFGAARFPADAVRRADRIMAWGEHDARWIRETHRSATVIPTGSPRIDLWRPEVIAGALPRTAEAPGHILFVSSISPFWKNPFWVSVHHVRSGTFGPGFDGDDDEAEFRMYDEVGPAYVHVKHVVRAVRQVAKRFPDTPVVFRPHHFEDPDAWEAVLGSYPNLTIDARSTSRSLVAAAAVVVQRGSSMAIESRVAARPVLTFRPTEGPWDGWASNLLGIPVDSVDGLVEKVDEILRDGLRDRPSAQEVELLGSRLAALEGPLAADRVVDEWERMLTPATSGRIEQVAPSATQLRRVRRALSPVRARVRDALARGRTQSEEKATRKKGPLAMDVEHKFPSLDVDALRADAQRLSDHLGRFKDVDIIEVGDREVLLRAARR